MATTYLSRLNPAQLRAVQHPSEIPLQILAGPGSGKTKVLTSRIAHLILSHDIPPPSICAVTFTNKAANEMRKRLTVILGEQRVAQVKMGTFHAICALFLRRNARLVGLEGNFTVCDAEESKKIIKKLLSPHVEYLASRNITLNENTAMSLISKLKTKGLRAANCLAQFDQASAGSTFGHDLDLTVAKIYVEYERALRKNNALDFDDLLVFGSELFKGNPSIVNWCRHVLVDEFQDTNVTQYDLMRHIAAVHRCVTVVGDPDQSIYGWRSAEVANLAKMKRDFPTCVQLMLEDNYRSTGSILKSSLAIVAQDKSRIQKNIRSSHPIGTTPVLQSFFREEEEVGFIAREIKRMIASTGDMLGWGDFVILLRFSALSRVVEQALRKEGIPHRVLAGQKFFDRLEVKDILAYLQIIDNPTFVPAFSRAINVPARGIGEKSLAEILHKAERMTLSPVELVDRICDGRTPDIKPPVRKKVASFVMVMRALRTLANEEPVPKLIKRLLELIEYQEHLKRSEKDWESRWENVEELINYAGQTQTGFKISPVNEPSGHGVHVGDEGQWEDAPDKIEFEEFEEVGYVKVKEGEPTTRISGTQVTQLRLFLQMSLLSTDTEEQKKEDNDKGKVTISTCHAAKGLEWPVVFIPAVEKSIFPHSRSDDTDEERRLLYVACTRAQGLLYLSHCTGRMSRGKYRKTGASEFVTTASQSSSSIFTNALPNLTTQTRCELARVLGRPIPDEDAVAGKLEEFNRYNGSRDYVVHGGAFSEGALTAAFTRPGVRGVSQAPNSRTRTMDMGQKTQLAMHRTEPEKTSGSPFATLDGRQQTMREKSHRDSTKSSKPTSVKPLTTLFKPHSQGCVGSSSKARAPRHHAEGTTTIPLEPSTSLVTNSLTQIIPIARRQDKNHDSFPQGAVLSDDASTAMSWSRRDALQRKRPASPNFASSDVSDAPAATSVRANDGPRKQLGMGRSRVGYSNKRFKPPTM